MIPSCSIKDESSSEQRSSPASEDASDRFTSINRMCRICCANSDGAHLGVDSCRACAAFFRRSVLQGKKYVCRRGGDKCDLNKSLGMMCRKCRFNKCLEKGMLPETAFGKKDAPRTSPESHEYNEDKEDSSAKTYLSKLVENPPTSLMQPYFLTKVAENYSRLRATRNHIESGILSFLPIPSTSTEPYLQGFNPCTTASISNIYRAFLPSMAEFIYSTFEDVNALSEEVKMLLFGAFVFASWGLESCYRTVKTVPREKQDTINILSEKTYLNLDRMDIFLCDASTVMLVKEDIEKLVRRCMGRPRQKVVSMMHDLNLSDEEMAALIGLLFWSHTTEDISERVEILARMKRDMIFEELHSYYILKETPNYAKRIGQLMCLYSAILVRLKFAVKKYSDPSGSSARRHGSPKNSGCFSGR